MKHFIITVKNNNLDTETNTRVEYDTLDEVKEMVKNSWSNATITEAIEIDLMTNKRTKLI